MKSVKKIISNLITGILFVTLIFMAFVVISSKASGGSPKILGYELKTVLSGSMEPGIQTGSIIAVKPGGDMTRFKKGDVITFKASEKKLITHRIYKVEGSGSTTRYITKGDNNNAPDVEPVLAANVVAHYEGLTIPYVGYGMEAAQSKEGTTLLMIVPGILLLIYSIITIWKAIREIEGSKKDVSASNS